MSEPTEADERIQCAKLDENARAICTCNSPWMSRCRTHGWRGKVDADHLAWLLLRYPRDTAQIHAACMREGFEPAAGYGRGMPVSVAPILSLEAVTDPPVCEGNLEYPHATSMRVVDYFPLTRVRAVKCPDCGALEIEEMP